MAAGILSSAHGSGTGGKMHVDYLENRSTTKDV
jgi:hypothetical protein